jgi:hypothetical protein
MFDINNEELKKLPNITGTIKCIRCGETHKVVYGSKIVNRKKTPRLRFGFVWCGELIYLVSIDGKDITRRFKSLLAET